MRLILTIYSCNAVSYAVMSLWGRLLLSWLHELALPSSKPWMESCGDPGPAQPSIWAELRIWHFAMLHCDELQSVDFVVRIDVKSAIYRAQGVGEHNG